MMRRLVVTLALWLSLALPAMALAADIYTDNFVNGWLGLSGETGSWNVTVFNSSAQVYSGSQSIFAQYTATWGGFLMEHPSGASTTGSSTLRVAIWRYPDGLNSTLYLRLHGAGSPLGAYVDARNYITGSVIPQNTWVLLEIPLADLGGMNTTVHAIEIQSEIAASFHFDALAFIYVAPPNPGLIYSESPIWDNGSWSASVNFFHGNSYSGAYAMQANITSAWGGLGLTKPGCMSTSGYSTLRFTLNGGSGGQALYAALTDASGNALQLIDVRDYVSGGVIPANSYSQVIVPLANLQAVSTTVCGVFIQSATPTTFYVDQLEISTQGGSSEWVPSYSQAGEVVYAEGSGWGWHIGSWSNVTIDPSSPITYAGNNSIAVTTGGQWGRLKILADTDFAFNTAGYDTLSLYLNIGMSEGEALYVGLLNESGSVIQYLDISAYTGSGTLDAYQWQPIRVPLSDMGATNQDIFGVEIQSSNPATFFVDEIQFVTTSGGSCSAE